MSESMDSNSEDTPQSRALACAADLRGLGDEAAKRLEDLPIALFIREDFVGSLDRILSFLPDESEAESEDKAEPDKPDASESEAESEVTPYHTIVALRRLCGMTRGHIEGALALEGLYVNKQSPEDQSKKARIDLYRQHADNVETVAILLSELQMGLTTLCRGLPTDRSEYDTAKQEWGEWSRVLSGEFGKIRDEIEKSTSKDESLNTFYNQIFERSLSAASRNMPYRQPKFPNMQLNEDSDQSPSASSEHQVDPGRAIQTKSPLDPTGITKTPRTERQSQDALAKNLGAVMKIAESLGLESSDQEEIAWAWLSQQECGEWEEVDMRTLYATMSEFVYVYEEYCQTLRKPPRNRARVSFDDAVTVGGDFKIHVYSTEASSAKGEADCFSRQITMYSADQGGTFTIMTECPEVPGKPTQEHPQWIMEGNRVDMQIGSEEPCRISFRYFDDPEEVSQTVKKGYVLAYIANQHMRQAIEAMKQAMGDS